MDLVILSITKICLITAQKNNVFLEKFNYEYDIWAETQSSMIQMNFSLLECRVVATRKKFLGVFNE